MGDLWDDLAQENARSAILYHATPEWFEESGRRDAEGLYRIMARLHVTRPCQDAGNRTILDLGGGIGRIALYLSPVAGRYYLLDVSREMLRQARAWLDGQENVSLVQGDGFTLAGVPDDSVDFAFSIMVFQHMDREVCVRYLMDLRRVLAQHGYAYLGVPMMEYPTRFAEAERGDWPANFRRWHPGEFLEVCARLGYAILEADCDRGLFLLQRGADANLTWENRANERATTASDRADRAGGDDAGLGNADPAATPGAVEDGAAGGVCGAGGLPVGAESGLCDRDA